MANATPHLLPRGERLLQGTIAELLSDSATEVEVNNPPSVDELPTYFELDPSSDNPETVRVYDVSGNIIYFERGIYNSGVGREHLPNTPYKQKITSQHWKHVVDSVEQGYLPEDPSITLVRNSASQFTIDGVDRTDFYIDGRVVRFNESDANTAVVDSSILSSGDTVVTLKTGGAVPTPLTSIEISIQPKGFISPLFVEHNQDGTHSDLTADSVTSAGDIETTAGGIKIPTGANIQVNSADPWATITLQAGTLQPTTTGGCADVEKSEAATNDVDYFTLAFDQTSQERAFANIAMPDSWDGGVIQFRFYWTAAAGTAAQTFELELGGRSFADDEAIDQAMGTFVGVSDALIATGDVHISAWSTDVTLAGTPAAGELIHLEVRRDVATDNLAADALLLAVEIRYKRAQYGD